MASTARSAGVVTMVIEEEAAAAARSETPAPDAVISVMEIQKLWILRSISRTLLAPLDRVKFVMQCQKELVRRGALRGEFRSTWACARHLHALEGPRSFWRGSLIQVISLLPIALAQIFIAVPTQSFIFNSWAPSTPAGYTCASYAALLGGGVAAAMVAYPLEFARFRLAVDIKPYKGAPYELRHSLAFFSQPAMNECPHYLYRGLCLYIIGSLVYQSVHNVLLNAVGPYVPAEYEDSGYGPALVQTACGVSIAAVSTMCLHPVDLVRHRMMIAVTDDKRRYANAMQCVTRIAQREGIRGFYHGASVTLLRMMTATGLLLVGLPY